VAPLLRRLIAELLAVKSAGELDRVLDALRAQGGASLRVAAIALAEGYFPLRLQRAAVTLAVEVGGEEGASLLRALLTAPNVDDEEQAAAVRALGGDVSPRTLLTILELLAADGPGGDTERQQAIFAHLAHVPTGFDWAGVLGAVAGSRLNDLHKLLGDRAPPALSALAAAVEVERRTRRGPSPIAPPGSLPAAAPEGTVHNPFLDAFEHRDPEKEPRLRFSYAYGVPTPAALRLIAEHQPLIEIGAGSGYWAWLLRQMHVDVVAYDLEPPDGTYRNAFFEGGLTWTEVSEGGAEAVHEHPERTLFLCWPPPASPMAEECLAAFHGDIVLYVGEWRGACATSAFFDALERSFTQVASEDLPSWYEQDALRVFRRRGG
jgi:hypothetical protein